MTLTQNFLLAARRLAQVVTVATGCIRAFVLLPFLALGLVLRPYVFDRTFYANQPDAGKFQRRFPLLHFLSLGAWQLKDPHPRFSQITMLLDYPALFLRPPVLNHVLNPRAEDEFPLLAGNLGGAHIGPEGNLEKRVWSLFRDDAQALSLSTGSLTPTPQIVCAIQARRIEASYGTGEGEVVVRLLERFPERVDHLLVLPWLGIRGGAERVTERFLALLGAHYAKDRLCIFLPEKVHAHSVISASELDFRMVAINDELPDANQATRMRIFDRIMVNVQPRTMHNANSHTAWLALRHFGQYYSGHTRTFTSLYSDVRLTDGTPIGYYQNHLPYIIDRCDGFICDNRAIIRKAAADFSLPAGDEARFHYVPTPIVGRSGGDPRTGLRQYAPSTSRRSLWMSRIAPEKRLDVLAEIARRMPERQFAVYGAILAALQDFDMSWRDVGNIDYRGEFEALDDLPMQQFDSYVFTSNGEGMPLAVLEATQAGLPVVAPDVGGIGEFIDSDTGWLVSGPDAVDEYVTALCRIEADPGEVRRRVANAQERLATRHSIGHFERTIAAIPGYLERGS